MWYYIIQYGLLTAICGFLVQGYSAPSVSVLVRVSSVGTWVLNFGLALIVPEDLFLTRNQASTDGLALQYRVLYWSVYLLTWTLIPVLQEWEDSGDETSSDRLKRSLRSNAIFYAVLLVAGVAGLILLILLKAGGDMGLITFLQCLATCWGMLLLFLLLGYAIADIPSKLWLTANPANHLQQLYHSIRLAEEDLDEAYASLNLYHAYVVEMEKQSRADPTRFEAPSKP